MPVKAEARARVKGIVHDASGSGQTLFIEPLVAVELGNAWREAQVAEAEEIARILDELSALIAANAAALRETLDALARFDLWAAKATLAADMDAIRAETADRPEVVLLSARHPGLTGRVIPIDIRLGDGYTALVVTGPNTGGKTVTLRTLGLLSLMHQAGLHVPAAAGSRLPIWRDVFADIGDEQSIAQSLSTFSGHLRSITRIVEAAGPGTLVLLDELGAGTDPTEGSALAQALLDHFIRAGRDRRGDDPLRRAQGVRPHDARRAQRRGRVRPRDAVADLPADDRPAGRQPGVRDRRAARACPTDIVADARSRLTEAQRSFEATLASIRATEGETSEALDRARAAELRAAEALRPAEEERRRARRERDEAVRAARVEAERIVERPARRAGRDARGARARDGDRAGPRSPRSRAPRLSPIGCPPLEPARVPEAPAVPRQLAGRRARPEPRPAAGRAGSRRSSKVASGRRWRRAGCGSPSTSTTSCRPSDGTGAPGPASADGGRDAAAATSNAAALRLERARTVASSLDSAGRAGRGGARGARSLPGRRRRWRASTRRRSSMDWGPVRCAMRCGGRRRPPAGAHVRPGERGEGGDGATIVKF